MGRSFSSTLSAFQIPGSIFYKLVLYLQCQTSSHYQQFMTCVLEQKLIGQLRGFLVSSAVFTMTQSPQSTHQSPAPFIYEQHPQILELLYLRQRLIRLLELAVHPFPVEVYSLRLVVTDLHPNSIAHGCEPQQCSLEVLF